MATGLIPPGYLSETAGPDIAQLPVTTVKSLSLVFYKRAVTWVMPALVLDGLQIDSGTRFGSR
jgi:hypothetical protein